MSTLAVFSASQHRDYSFLAPITALFWRDVIGHTPRVLLTGAEAEWSAPGSKADNRYRFGTQTALQALRSFGIETTFVPMPAGAIWQTATWAQVIRPNVVADASIPADQWVIMSDADLWPLRRSFYVQHEGASRARLVSYYSNGDHFFGKANVLERFTARMPFQTLPMCHVAMRASEWRTLLGISLMNEPSIAASADYHLAEYDRSFLAHFAGPDRGMAIWCADQYMLTHRICAQDWFPSEALLIQRRGLPPDDRLDRGNWRDWSPDRFDADRWTDAHVHKGPEEPERWATLLPVIDALMPQHSSWARAYREDYCRA